MKACSLIALALSVLTSVVALGQPHSDAIAALSSNAQSVFLGHVTNEHRISQDGASDRVFDLEVIARKNELGDAVAPPGETVHIRTAKPVLPDTDYIFLARRDGTRKDYFLASAFEVRTMNLDTGENGVVIDADHFAFMPSNTEFKTITLLRSTVSTDNNNYDRTQSWVLNSLVPYREFLGVIKVSREKRTP